MAPRWSGHSYPRAQILALARDRHQWWRSWYSGSISAQHSRSETLFRKLFSQYGRPRAVIPDKLGSYNAALKSLAHSIDHRRHKGLKSISEGSHRPTRRRVKSMALIKSPGQAQLFWSVHDQVQTVFRPRRHKLSAPAYRQSRSDAHSIWDDITCELKAAWPGVWGSFSARADKLTMPFAGRWAAGTRGNWTRGYLIGLPAMECWRAYASPLDRFMQPRYAKQAYNLSHIQIWKMPKSHAS